MARNYYNASIANLQYRLRRFKDILQEELDHAVRMNKGDMVNMIQDQLWEGEDGYHKPIKPMYTTKTIKWKQKHGQPSTRVTLKQTGEFYDSLIEGVNPKPGGGIYVTSTDTTGKATVLLNRYGLQVLRLNDENFTRYVREELRPALQKLMKKRLLENERNNS